MKDKDKKSHFIDKWPDWKSETCEGLNINEEHLELVCDSSFDFILKAMDNPTMPIIKISKFGTLRPKIGQVNRVIRSAFRWYKEGAKSKEDLIGIIKKAWPVRNRLINEYYGEFTSGNWHQYFKASEGKKFVEFVKNKYIKPRRIMPYTYNNKKRNKDSNTD